MKGGGYYAPPPYQFSPWDSKGRGKGKGKSGGRFLAASWSYDDSVHAAQRTRELHANSFPKVAQQLDDLRSSLNDDGMRAYRALQLALQRHSTPHGSRPNFERDFHDSLAAVFPEALDIGARQIGSHNQWEVRVDGGPAMFCSVRLEVLTDDPTFIRDVKNKAKIVKDTLLENGAKWKRSLQPDSGGFSFEKLTQFEKECAYRSENSEFARSGMGGGHGGGGCGGPGFGPNQRDDGSFGPESDQFSGANNRWVDPQDICEICNKPLDEDQLNGTHMCKVFATFCCADCRYSWTSHHGRLRPNGEVMGQQCMRCKGAGEMKDWRVNSGLDNNYNDDYSMASRRSRASVMGHQSSLCEACREFGNCMGIFYDPFVLTTALSLVSGNFVQWKAFSTEVPELLVADLGPGMKDIQVCLQPHVYVALPPGDDDDDSDLGRRPASQQRRYDEGYRRDHIQHQGLAGGGVKDQDLLSSFLASAGGGPRPPRPDLPDDPPRPPLRGRPSPAAGGAGDALGAGAGPGFLGQPAAPASCAGPTGLRSSASSDFSTVSSLPAGRRRAPSPSERSAASSAAPPFLGAPSVASSDATVPAGAYAAGAYAAGGCAGCGYAGGGPRSPPPVSAPPPPPSALQPAAPASAAAAAPSAPAGASAPARTNKGNKIGSLAGGGAGAAFLGGCGSAASNGNNKMGGPAAGACAASALSPAADLAPPLATAAVGDSYLDQLLPIRRAQFLQLVTRHLKATGGNEADKYDRAEEFLRRNDGNYEKSYQFVRTLIDNQSKSPM